MIFSESMPVLGRLFPEKYSRPTNLITISGVLNWTIIKHTLVCLNIFYPFLGILSLIGFRVHVRGSWPILRYFSSCSLDIRQRGGYYRLISFLGPDIGHNIVRILRQIVTEFLTILYCYFGEKIVSYLTDFNITS
jgi:hypothetical protein